MTEVWKPIPGHPNYEVSSTGGVRSIDKTVRRGDSDFFSKGRVLKCSVGKNGYKCVSLGRGNNFYVHYLVLLAFVGPRSDGMTCSHKDNNRTNNNINNLFYESLSDNIKRQVEHGTKQEGERNGHAKLKAHQVKLIRSMPNTGYGFFSNLAKELSVSSKTIADAYKGVTWKCAA
jgi:hypothetical protein